VTIHLAVDQAPVGELPVLTGRRGHRVGVLRAVLANRKATVGAILLMLFSLVAMFPTFFAPYDPNADIFRRSLGPSHLHWLGTTAYGQDIYSQVIWGTRVSIVIAVMVGLFSTVLSVIIGVSSAYLGGLSDSMLSLVTDVFLVIPTFPLVIVLAAYERNGGSLMIIIVLVVTGWSYGARQLRSQTQSLRNRDYLESARVRGERSFYIIVREVLPTMTSLIVANFLGAALYAVLAAAGLQFVGLGNVNTVSWGSMLYWAQNNEALQTGQYLWALVPGICIALLGAGLALLNYAFDEISNPALRPQRRIRVRRRAA
jgi:peptide/nickel transport system permease protein